MTGNENSCHDCQHSFAAFVHLGIGLSRVGARIFDFQKKYDVKIDGWHDAQNRKLYWYRMEVAAPIPDIVSQINAIPARAPFPQKQNLAPNQTLF